MEAEKNIEMPLMLNINSLKLIITKSVPYHLYHPLWLCTDTEFQNGIALPK